MCGRFALHASPEVIALEFALAAVPAFAPRYNIAPGSDILAVRARDGAREAVLVRWGLVPAWAKDARVGGARMINARAETVAEKPAFRAAYRRRRCLVPASGFFEWQARPGGKQPWYIRPRTGELFAFAGLWERWSGPEGPLETCAIVVTQANEALAPVHDRMPVIVAPEHWQRWLDCSAPAGVDDLLRPCDPALLVLYPVGRAVNDARRDEPSLVRPLAAPA
ncbi:MAG: SOS response-associated peptidase [Burkholderiales bacterium]|nr:SOS response-associated peptidase [Burkholderiales bacterium]